ncbi:hypothetical protein F5B19DRAFT_458385 [Rostrohypoxylon terebratum]|nr:hypothetical protein F5B19DRAFT_458385 [Rostrohypoxylon terebratum]
MAYNFSDYEPYFVANEWYPSTDSSEAGPYEHVSSERDLFSLDYPLDNPNAGEQPSQLHDDNGMSTSETQPQSISWDSYYDTATSLTRTESIENRANCDYGGATYLSTTQRRRENEDSQSRHSPPDNPDAKERLACPYYKHDPIRFKLTRSCAGPGFREIHRLKEHLKRRHGCPQHRCSRCLVDFPNAAGLREHQRAPRACEVTLDQKVDGKMTAAQQTALLSKKRMPAHSTDESKWNDIYCILFPDTDPANVPSPYVETGLESFLSLFGSEISSQAALEATIRDTSDPALEGSVKYELWKVISSSEDEYNKVQKSYEIACKFHQKLLIQEQPECPSQGTYDLGIVRGNVSESLAL